MAFAPIATERLLLRAPRPGDADALVARRNHPDVARYQDWPLPYRIEDARRTLAAHAEPADGSWFMVTVADPGDTTIIGDLALHMTNGMRTAEIGYTLGAEHWGRGYAIEAGEALVAHLFDAYPVTRVWGALHPDNTASAVVLERLGMVFEGHTRLSYWNGDDNSDDWIYGMTRDAWQAWVTRPRHRPGTVELVGIDDGSAFEVARLRTHKTQERFVAPVVASYADALFPEIVDGAPVVPWMRAVRADGEWAGFVMLAQRTEHHPEPYLWRLLVDARHQRRGIGARILDEITATCRDRGDTGLLTSWVEGRWSPRPFYERYGFVPTGRVVDGETEARLAL